MPHSSLRKAASVFGLGQGSMVGFGLEENERAFDMSKLEGALSYE